MKRKQLLFLLLIVAVLGGIGLATYHQQQGSWVKEPNGAGKKLLGDLPLNDIASISIRQGTNEVTLIKKGDVWGVHECYDYPADFPHISDFLLKLRDLKAVQTEKASVAELPRWQLAPEAGADGPIVIQFKKSDGTPFQTLLLGKQHRYGAGTAGSDAEGIADGRYIRLSDSDEVVLTSVPLNNIWTVPASWVSQDFFSVKHPKSIVVTNPVTANSWKIFRETASGEWKVGDAGKKVDLQKADEIANAFGWATFADVKPGNELASQKSLQMDIETFDGFHYTIHIGPKTNNNYLITVSVTAQIPPKPSSGKEGKPEGKAPELQQQQLETKLKKEQMCEDWTYLVAATTVDPILKGPFQLSTPAALPVPRPRQ